jgi:hypothetical protein
MKTRSISFLLAAGLLMAAIPVAVSAAPEFKCEPRGKSKAVVHSLPEIVAFDGTDSAISGVKVVGHWKGDKVYYCVHESTKGDITTWRVGKGTNIAP